jgi:transposase
MSRDELRAEYKRLKVQVQQLLAGKPPEGVKDSDLRQLVEKLQTLTGEYDRKVDELQAQIAELKRELFGPKSDRLTPEQQEKLSKLNEDLEAEAQSPAAASDGILEEEEGKKKKRKRTGRRGARHPLPAHLETETVTIEPQLTPCPCCGKMPEQIGEEVSEEIDLIPAKLIRRRTVRPKYACRCGEAGVAIAPLPPRLVPQSRLGLGLAVHVVLARYDDHLSFYRLEQQFRERHGVVIFRQQMVQWAEHIATWLMPVYDAMWKAMMAGGYLQIDETPVKVLDPDVKGKAARGYLWFYAVPGGDVILEFDPSRGLEPVRQRLEGFEGTIQTDAYEVYQALERKESQIERIGCMAHVRRYFRCGRTFPTRYGSSRRSGHCTRSRKKSGG